MHAVLLLTTLVAGPLQDVSVEVIPGTPWIEKHRSHLSLQCDFLLTNESASTVSIVEIVLKEFDDEGDLIRRRFVNRDGTAPSIFTLRKNTIPAGGRVHLFNPFHHFEAGPAPAGLEFDFTLQSSTTPWTETVAVEGQVYEPRTPLRLPMNGRLAVSDGHDFLSHHRRFGLDHPVLKAAGLRVNSGLYASDLVAADAPGEDAPDPLHRSTWDAPVVAPGAGRVVRAVGQFPDNRIQSGTVLRSSRVSIQNFDTLLGNFVVIDHENGEFSVLAHLRQGSVEVESGQAVKAGDPVGKVGLSGATGHVHLHYQLQDGASLRNSAGLPSAFARYRLYRGKNHVDVENAPVDTGDIVEHR